MTRISFTPQLYNTTRPAAVQKPAAPVAMRFGADAEPNETPRSGKNLYSDGGIMDALRGGFRNVFNAYRDGNGWKTIKSNLFWSGASLALSCILSWGFALVMIPHIVAGIFAIDAAFRFVQGAWHGYQGNMPPRP